MKDLTTVRTWVAGATIWGTLSCSTAPVPPAPSGPPRRQAEQLQPTSRRVVDPQGRFALVVDSLSPVQVDVLPGYVSLVAELERPLHCFIFEEPLDAGAALTRALDSLETGAELQLTRLPEIDTIRGEPLVSLDVAYETTLPPMESGRVATLLLASSDFPMVCSYDAPSEIERGIQAARSAMQSFVRLCGDAPCPASRRDFELWRVSTPGSRGFVLHERLVEGADVLAYGRSSVFELSELGLSTFDRLSVEREDDHGLLLGKWLTYRDARVALRAQVQRLEAAPTPSETAEAVGSPQRAQPDESKMGAPAPWNYRYGIERGLDRHTGTFQVDEALRASVRLTSSLDSAPRRAPAYVPLVRGDGPTWMEVTSRGGGLWSNEWSAEGAVDSCVLVDLTGPKGPTWRSDVTCSSIEAEPVDAKPIEAEPIDAKPVEVEPVDAKPSVPGQSHAERLAHGSNPSRD